MSLSVLPAELFDAICEPLASHPSTLAVLARTSATLNASAIRVLYSSLTISSYARNLSAICTLASRPDLARLVRSFSITLSDHDAGFHSFYALLQRALIRMPQLVLLDLLVDASASWVLSGVQSLYAHLEHFSCSFPLDAHLSAFLARTPALLSLQISASSPALETIQPFAPSHIPRLSSYTGPASLIPLLAPRPLTTLHLSGDLTLSDIPQPDGASTNAQMLPDSVRPSQTDASTSGTQVQVLSAVTSVPPAPILAALARAYPSLVCLRLMTTCAFWEVPDMTFYKRIAETLATLPDLSVFELSGMHWEQRTKSRVSAHSPQADAMREWISPPVTPRAVEFVADVEEEAETRGFDLGEAFLEWSY
ncbi:hypothetical protein B0H21DRAFT_192591 [Amylocystis lapponica]|nr:hypothetical protein B0H21DRAFT_192591 [Amylocystis lapponica]